MRFDLDLYAAWRRDHPDDPLHRDVESWMALEIEQLREEAHELRLMVEEAALAENLNAEDAKRERAAVVAYLRDQANAEHPTERGYWHSIGSQDRKQRGRRAA